MDTGKPIYGGLRTYQHRSRGVRVRGRTGETVVYRTGGHGYSRPHNLPSNKNIANNQMKIVHKYSRNKRRKRRVIKKIIKPRVPRAIQPKRMTVLGKATQYYEMDTGAGSTLQLVSVPMPSVIKPHGGNDTGQFLGYDQWKALYNTGIVLGSKITVRFHNKSTVAIIVGISPTKPPQSFTSLGNYEYYMELPGTRARLLSPDVDHVTISHKKNVPKYMDIKNPTDEIAYRNDLPTETEPSIDMAHWHVWMQGADSQGGTPTTGLKADVLVTIEQIILLYDAIVPSRSTYTP